MLNFQKFKEDFTLLFCTGMTDNDHVINKKYRKKSVRHMSPNDSFFIVGITKKGTVIAQMTHDLEKDIRNGFTNDQTLFILSHNHVVDLLFQKKYLVAARGNTGSNKLVQIPLPGEPFHGLEHYENLLNDLNVTTQTSGGALHAHIEGGNQGVICTIYIQKGNDTASIIGHYLSPLGGEMHNVAPEVVIEKFLATRTELSKALC